MWCRGRRDAARAPFANSLWKKKTTFTFRFRPPPAHRGRERKEGVSYFFLSEDEFVAKTKQDGFLEWACFCGNYYGTPKKNVEDMLERGIDVILEIEVQGAMKIRAKYPEAVFVFVLPPSQKELESRLSGRGTETPEAIKNRLNRAKSEYNYIEKYNYILINDTVEQAVGRFKAIMEAERCLVSRNRPFIESLLNNEEESD